MPEGTVRERREDCTGCGACLSVCAQGAIVMTPDAEGFAYPVIDAARCTRCGACEKRCPSGHLRWTNQPKAYGAQNGDIETRRASSSGGIFSALAEETLERGGAVFGAVFDETLRVEHVGAITRQEVAAMRGSKYVQSDAASALKDAAEVAAHGMPVLFSGTPCQVAGLYALLGKRAAPQLLTVDFVCHGAPSPGVFASYLRELEAANGSARAYAFRDKRRGWKDFSAVARFADGTERAGQQTTDPYLVGFLQNLYLRPACHAGTLRHGHHPADITLADLWGAERALPGWDDDTGLSLVLCNTDRGRAALAACKGLELRPIHDIRVLAPANPSLFEPAKPHEKRAVFFKRYVKHGFRAKDVFVLTRPSKLRRMMAKLRRAPEALGRRLRKLSGA